jgi:hypothetical protein
VFDNLRGRLKVRNLALLLVLATLASCALASTANSGNDGMYPLLVSVVFPQPNVAVYHYRNASGEKISFSNALPNLLQVGTTRLIKSGLPGLRLQELKAGQEKTETWKLRGNPTCFQSQAMLYLAHTSLWPSACPMGRRFMLGIAVRMPASPRGAQVPAEVIVHNYDRSPSPAFRLELTSQGTAHGWPSEITLGPGKEKVFSVTALLNAENSCATIKLVEEGITSYAQAQICAPAG